MLAQDVVERIESLVAAGQLSRRRIAAMAGVSRATVTSIALGQRRQYEPPDPGEERLGPIERCRRCGALVYAPCLLCQARDVARASRRRTGGEGGPLGLELRDSHRRRYEVLRRQKDAEAARCNGEAC